jgi:rSAM/selenodomain-associated transferase 2
LTEFPEAQPVLSIIVPVLNDSAALANLLSHLQPFRPQAQIIVVDAGQPSTIDTQVAKLTDHYLFSAQGRGIQMHTGTTAASASSYWFLHADSKVPADAVALIEVALSKAQWGRFDVVLQGQSKWLAVISTCMNWRSALTGICTGDQGIFVKASAYQQVGGFQPIALMEDIALSGALKQLGWPARIRRPLASAGRRWDTQGVWRTILLMWSLRLQFWLGVDPRQLNRRYQVRR